MAKPEPEVPEAKPRALTASVSQVKASDLKRRGQASQRSKDAEWQREAYDAFHNIGELRFAARYIANALGKVRFSVGMRDTPGGPLRVIPQPDADIGDGEVKPTDIDEAMRDCLMRLRGRDGTFRSLITTYGGHQFIAGEDYLVGAAGLDGEEWEFLSTSELVKAIKDDQGGGNGKRNKADAEDEEKDIWQKVAGPGDPDRSTIPDGSVVYRFWQKDLEYRERADSSVRAVLDVCDSLRTGRAIKTAGDRSRLISNGLLLIPSEAELPTVDVEIDGELIPDHLRLVDELLENMEAVMADPGSAAATLPLILQMKADLIEKVKHITFGRQIDETITQRIDHDIRSLAQGLDLTPEKITGVGDVNHWTAWQVAEETISAHVGPLAQSFCEDLTVSYLIPTYKELMKAKAADPANWETWKYAVVFDLSEIVSSPNAADHAKWAWENLIMSDDDVLGVIGFDPKVKPSPEEVEERLRIINAKNASSTAGQISEHPVTEAAEPAPDPVPPQADKPDGEGDQQDGEGDGEDKQGPPASGPPKGPPQKDDKGASDAEKQAGRRDLLAAMVLGAAVMSAERALERAGARLATRVSRSKDADARARAEGQPAAKLSVILGPGGVERVGLDDDHLLQDAWMPFAERMVMWGVSPEIATRIVTATDNVTRRRLYDADIDVEACVKPLIDLAVV